ncbi:MAG: pyridoxamine 5'-phosphate oxidase family protein [Acidobacteria bacterium]|nr:pyridoxamine 5'-phosphate oxidase family protein [Acidobacteriota bacterium]
MTNAPFHSGELAVQERAGEAAIARRNGSAVSGKVMGGARLFLTQQPMIVLSSSDEQSAMWASIVFGRPGFLASADGASLDIDLNRALVDPRDPLWVNAGREMRLGSLVIELASRRRIRINGPARVEANNHLRIDVEESYPACPKYITRRHVRIASLVAPVADGARPSGTGLSAAPLAMISNADTLFVATRSDEGGYDVSHRGGLPGFVKVTGPLTIQWPEYPGNSMFNTLGNLVHNPEAGLAIPDFERGRILQLTGSAVTLWDQSDPANETGGTRRFVEMRIARWQELPLPSDLSAELLDYSPFNPPVVAP